jgi:hypothetical protein
MIEDIEIKEDENNEQIDNTNNMSDIITEDQSKIVPNDHLMQQQSGTMKESSQSELSLEEDLLYNPKFE